MANCSDSQGTLVVALLVFFFSYALFFIVPMSHATRNRDARQRRLRGLPVPSLYVKPSKYWTGGAASGDANVIASAMVRPRFGPGHGHRGPSLTLVQLGALPRGKVYAA